MAKRLNAELNLILTKEQKPIVNFFITNQISILTGMAGTSKTTLAIYYGLKQRLAGEFESVVITKPLQTTGQEIGFLPGVREEKEQPFYDSYTDVIEKIVGAVEMRDLLLKKRVEYLSLPYVRGKTCERRLLIMDEAQNADLHTIMSFVTRGGEGSKIILLGDPYQSDIKKSGLQPFINMVEGIEGVGHIELGEEFQMRSKLIVDLHKAYIKTYAKA